MIAGLPMYDRPGTAPANDALWHAVRERLGYGPQDLSRDRDLWDLWEAPDLVLGQTCSLPFRARLRGKVQVIGSPDFRLPDAPPGTYYSVLVKRADDPRTLPELMAARVVINQAHSHSGHAALWMAARDRGLTPNITGESGGHVNSARMIAEDRADLAILDAVSWSLMRRHDGFAARLTAVGRSPATAAMPYICAPGMNVEAIRSALRDAFASLPPDACETLHIHGLVTLPESDYCDLPDPPAL